MGVVSILLVVVKAVAMGAMQTCGRMPTPHSTTSTSSVGWALLVELVNGAAFS